MTNYGESATIKNLKNWLLSLKKEKYIYVDIDVFLKKIKEFQ